MDKYLHGGIIQFTALIQCQSTHRLTSKHSKLVKHHLSVVDAFCKQFIRGPLHTFVYLFIFNKFMCLTGSVHLEYI